MVPVAPCGTSTRSPLGIITASALRVKVTSSRMIIVSSFDRRAHHRRGRLRDRAAVAREADVFDRPAVELEKHRVVIAAKRVVALDLPRGVRQLAKIARVLVVIEDDLLVQLS